MKERARKWLTKWRHLAGWGVNSGEGRINFIERKEAETETSVPEMDIYSFTLFRGQFYDQFNCFTETKYRKHLGSLYCLTNSFLSLSLIWSELSHCTGKGMKVFFLL